MLNTQTQEVFWKYQTFKWTSLPPFLTPGQYLDTKSFELWSLFSCVRTRKKRANKRHTHVLIRISMLSMTSLTARGTFDVTIFQEWCGRWRRWYFKWFASFFLSFSLCQVWTERVKSGRRESRQRRPTNVWSSFNGQYYISSASGFAEIHLFW